MDLDKIEYRGESSFRHLLYKAAERKLKDKARHWRRAKRDPARQSEARDSTGVEQLLVSYSGFCTPSQAAIAHERLERIEAAFDRLPERYRHVIVLSRVVGLSNEELAAELRLQPAHARTLLSRALVRLAALIDGS